MKTIREAILSVRNFDFKNASEKEIEDALPTFGMNNEEISEIPKKFEPYMGWGIKFWQYPNQLSKLLCFLRGKKIDSYFEMGVRWGGTFIIMNEFLMKFNPLLESHALDIIPPSEILHIYQTEFRDLHFWYHEMETQNPFFFQRIEGGENLIPNKKIDLVFIDACHSYQCIKKDYFTSLMLGAKYIIFHDIVNCKTRGSQIAWQEIKKLHKNYYEFVDQYDEMDGKYLGIGVIEVTKEDYTFPMFKPYYHHLFDW